MMLKFFAIVLIHLTSCMALLSVPGSGQEEELQTHKDAIKQLLRPKNQIFSYDAIGALGTILGGIDEANIEALAETKARPNFEDIVEEMEEDVDVEMVDAMEDGDEELTEAMEQENLNAGMHINNLSLQKQARPSMKKLFDAVRSKFLKLHKGSKPIGLYWDAVNIQIGLYIKSNEDFCGKSRSGIAFNMAVEEIMSEEYCECAEILGAMNALKEIFEAIRNIRNNKVYNYVDSFEHDLRRIFGRKPNSYSDLVSEKKETIMKAIRVVLLKHVATDATKRLCSALSSKLDMIPYLTVNQLAAAIALEFQ